MRSSKPCGRSFEHGETERSRTGEAGASPCTRLSVRGKETARCCFTPSHRKSSTRSRRRPAADPVEVFVPDLVDGEIEFDEEGRVFLVEQFPNGDGSTHERKIFLLQISKKGEVLVDGKAVDRVQPFPMRYGSGTIRDGKLVFNDIRQRTTVIKRATTTLSKPCDDTRGEKPSSSDASTACAQGETPS